MISYEISQNFGGRSLKSVTSLAKPPGIIKIGQELVPCTHERLVATIFPRARCLDCGAEGKLATIGGINVL
jgi:hypothetical protein